MTRRWTDMLWLVLVGLVAVMVFVWAHPNDRDSSFLNRGWNGLSEASEALHASALLSYGDLPEVTQPATLIVMPQLELEPAAEAAIDSFLEDGGTVIVMDDFGYGNDLLQELGVGVKLNGALLMDPLYCYRDATMPKIEVAGVSAEAGPISVVLNRATWLEAGGGVEVWARSSYFSYGDEDADGIRNGHDPDGPLPVGAVAHRGPGTVVVVSDSSLLLNSMVQAGDNIEAVTRFVQGDVFIDQVHLPEAKVDEGKGDLDAAGAALGSGAGAAGLVVLSCGLAVAYAWYNRGARL